MPFVGHKSDVVELRGSTPLPPSGEPPRGKTWPDGSRPWSRFHEKQGFIGLNGRDLVLCAYFSFWSGNFPGYASRSPQYLGNPLGDFTRPWKRLATIHPPKKFLPAAPKTEHCSVGLIRAVAHGRRSGLAPAQKSAFLENGTEYCSVSFQADSYSFSNCSTIFLNFCFCSGVRSFWRAFG